MKECMLLKEWCGNCDHLRECGCLNAHEVDKTTLDGITVQLIDEGTVTPLIDVLWCSRWEYLL